MCSIIQWNCLGFRPRYTDIKDLLATSSPVCLCLQKTKLRPTDTIPVRRYSAFRKDHEHNGIACGGVAILTRHDVPASQHPLSSTLQAVAVRVFVNVLITICSIYIPPGEDVSLSDLEALVDELPRPFLLLGDFNAHSPLWGCSTTDVRGRRVD